MKPVSYISIIRLLVFLHIVVLGVNCKKEISSTTPLQPRPLEPIFELADDNLVVSRLESQTRTATFLNNLNNFQDVYVNAYPKASAQDVATDNGIYAYTNKLTTQRGYASLSLQGFGFTIPVDATIEDITVRVRRFKKGTPAIKDYLVSVMQSYSGGPTNGVSTYGFMWRNGDIYPGNYYPDKENEFVFSQSGSGNNGGYDHNRAYQWTPAMINLEYFGLRIDVYPPEGKGSVVVYYDQVEIAVQYSVP